MNITKDSCGQSDGFAISDTLFSKLNVRFLISKFNRLVLIVILFPLGDSPASEEEEFFLLTPPMKMEQTVCSETSPHKIQTPGNHTKKRI